MWNDPITFKLLLGALVLWEMGKYIGELLYKKTKHHKQYTFKRRDWKSDSIGNHWHDN